MIGVRIYAAPLPDGSIFLAVPPAAVQDLGAAARLVATHPDRLRIDVLAPRGAPVASEQAVVTLVRRAACAATFPPAGQAAAGRATLPALRGAWYAALVVWGWLTLLAAAQSLAEVLGGLWLAIGLPLVRRAARRRDDTAWAEPAGWLAVSISGATIRTLEHAGLSQLAEIIAGAGHGPTGETGSTGWIGLMDHAGEETGAGVALRRAADACAAAGVPELAPYYAALAGGRRPAGIWSSVASVASMLSNGDGPKRRLEELRPQPPDEPAGHAAPQPEPEVRHELL